MECSELRDSATSEIIETNLTVNSDQISLQNSPKKSVKRSQEYPLNDMVKRPNNAENQQCNKSTSNCSSIDDCSKNRRRRAPRSSGKKVHLDPNEVKNVLEDKEDEIEDVLEEAAQKNYLTATNVKNILRPAIANEHVLAMVRNTMKTENNEGDEFEEAVFEPKLTRSKVKELREKHHRLPWPVPSPVKQQESATKSLLEEFSDESSSDEDYKPSEDECHSDEDNMALSPKSTDLDSSFSENSLSIPVKTADEDSEDENALVIALPELEPTEVDKIALRTRSKLALNDTPLEAIEASFVAPDITADMYDTDTYDTQCDNDEWRNFLSELNKPIECIVTTEKFDDAEDDPEYNVLDDDDRPDELDFLDDSTVQISTRELNALMVEVMDSAQPNYNDSEKEGDEIEVPSSGWFSMRERLK